jgi:hypothetical protein
MAEMPTEEEVVSYLANFLRNQAFPEIMRGIFTLVLDGTVEVVSGGVRILIETLEASQHAIYLPPSVMVLDNHNTDVYQTIGVGNSDQLLSGIHATIVKTRETPFVSSSDLDKVHVSLELRSKVLSNINVAYRVWRVTGLEG